MTKFNLGRRFDWQDTELTYRKVKDEDIEILSKGRYQFETYDTAGNKFIGAGFETSVAEMTFHELWKLAPGPSGKGTRVVAAQAKLVDVV